MPDISTATAARWGQTVLPVAAAGVYPPSAGDTTDVTKATLWLYDETGTITNTAIHGNVDPNGSGAGTWLVDTTWYDVHGNAARVLSAAGRQKALSSSPDPAQQAQAAELASKYNFYGDDGTRIEDEYKPAQTSVLRDGTPGLYRAHTSYIYDGAQDGPHSSASLGGPGKPAYSPDEDTFGLFVETRDSAADPQMLRDSPEAEHDVVVTRYSYDPVVDGDASGWTLGVPTRTKTQLQDGTWSVETARFNADGQQIETRSPGGSVDANGAGTDAHSSVTDYYSAGSSNPSCDISGHPERAQWDGLTCVVRPGGQPSNQPVAILHYQSYGADLQPLVVTETAGSTTRTTTTTYDAMDRVTKRVVSASGTGVDPDTRITSVTYASTTGLEVSSSDAGSTGVTTPSTITHSYDNWGRVMSYTDANGLVSSTQYTIDGGIASFDDGTGTGSYTYSYDDADGVQGEHRGLRTSVAVGLAAGTTGRFTIRYDADGRVGRLTYPDGLQANIGHTDSGATTSLEYAPSGASQPMIGFWNTVDVNGRVASSSSVASHQSYSYDNLGRLSEVRDWNELSADGGASEKCSVRRYGFTESSERSGADYFGPALDGSCQTDTAQASVSQTYDSAGRRIDTGYAYDSLGRTLTIPAADSNNSDPASDGEAATYYASDMIRTLTHAGPAKTVTTYGIDPDGRVTTVSTSVGGAETDRMLYQYSDSSDAPSRVLESNDGGASWSSTRYIEIPGMGAVATVADDSVQYLLSNIHGDIVAAQDPALGAGQVESYGEFDEYGNPIGQPGSQSRYGYLGVKQRSTDTPGRALVLMGARVYNPKTGAFLSVDPVAGANATPYGYPEDPVNDADVSGASPAPPPGDGATSAPEPGGKRSCDNSRVWEGAPIVDRKGFVNVPSEYCYDGGPSTLHDYCTKSPDKFGDVSFKGPCAYHDMCLQYGWGDARSDCDHILRWELARNCNYYYDRHSGGVRNRVTCRATADHYYAVVRVKTVFTDYTRSTNVSCHLYWRHGGVECK
jgi:RHS repeat-associated protein